MRGSLKSENLHEESAADTKIAPVSLVQNNFIASFVNNSRHYVINPLGLLLFCKGACASIWRGQITGLLMSSLSQALAPHLDTSNECS